MTVAPWVSSYDLYDPADPNADVAIQFASDVLFQLAGQRFAGVRSVVERYYAACPRHFRTSTEVTRAWINGVRCDSLRRGYDCRTLLLRGGPVHALVSVHRVAYDGTLALVDPIEYELIGSRMLRPIGGLGWTLGADLAVKYTYGEVPTAAAKAACIELANNICWSMSGDTRCQLPTRVTQMTRQGVSWTLLDPHEFMADGRTGIYTIDLFLKTVNPAKALKRSKVFSPDLPTGKRIRRGSSSPYVDPYNDGY
jgi:hypothetical protein